MSTATKHNQIPSDFPVKVLTKAGMSKAKDPVTCGTCGRSWDDAIATSWTPAPSARCPFEYFHEDADTPTPPSTETQAEAERVLREKPANDARNHQIFYGDNHNCPECDAITSVVVEHKFDDHLSADFIVRAVNSHDVLVAALRNLIKFMDDSKMSTTTIGGTDPFKYGGFEYSVVTEARAALSTIDKEGE